MEIEAHPLARAFHKEISALRNRLKTKVAVLKKKADAHSREVEDTVFLATALFGDNAATIVAGYGVDAYLNVDMDEFHTMVAAFRRLMN